MFERHLSVKTKVFVAVRNDYSPVCGTKKQMLSARLDGPTELNCFSAENLLLTQAQRIKSNTRKPTPALNR